MSEPKKMFPKEDEEQELRTALGANDGFLTGTEDKFAEDIDSKSEDSNSFLPEIEGILEEDGVEQVEMELGDDEEDGTGPIEPMTNNHGKPLEEEDILDLVKKDIEDAKEYHSLFAESFIEANAAYHAIIDEDYNIEGRSQISSSDVMDTIEWIMPSLMRIFTGSQDVVVIQPIGEEDVPSSELNQDLMNYQFMYKMEGFTRMYAWFKDSLIYGTGIIKLTWGTEHDKKRFRYAEMSAEEFELLATQDNISIESYDEFERIESIMGADEEEITNTVLIYKNVKGFIKRIRYAGPIMENIPISSFYIERGARSIKEANFVAHRVKRTMDYLRRMQRDGIYHNVDMIVPHAEGDEENTEFSKFAPIEAQVDSFPSDTRLEAPQGREQLWVWECWVKLDVDGDGLLEPLLVTVCNNTLLRVEENPFDHGEAPFEILVPIIDTHKFYGISMTKLVVEFQRMKTALLRNMFDNVSFAVNNWYLVRREAMVDTNALRNLIPGAIVMADDPNNGIREMQPKGLPEYAFNLLDYLDTMKEERVGMPKMVQGLDPKSLANKTATGLTSTLASGQQRLELIARLFAETGVKNLFRKMISLNQQFIDKSMTVRLFDKVLQITPDKLDGSFDLMVNVGIGAGLREMVQQQMLQLLQIMSPMAEIGLVTPENIYNVMSKLLESMGIKDIKKFITLPAGGGMPVVNGAGGTGNPAMTEDVMPNLSGPPGRPPSIQEMPSPV